MYREMKDRHKTRHNQANQAGKLLHFGQRVNVLDVCRLLLLLFRIMHARVLHCSPLGWKINIRKCSSRKLGVNVSLL